jgi:hypothetical protein
MMAVKAAVEAMFKSPSRAIIRVEAVIDQTGRLSWRMLSLARWCEKGKTPSRAADQTVREEEAIRPRAAIADENTRVLVRAIVAAAFYRVIQEKISMIG